jgi:hypothetical protein
MFFIKYLLFIGNKSTIQFHVPSASHAGDEGREMGGERFGSFALSVNVEARFGLEAFEHCEHVWILEAFQPKFFCAKLIKLGDENAPKMRRNCGEEGLTNLIFRV